MCIRDSLVSQWFGAKQYDKMRHYVAMSIYLAAAFAIVMTIGFEALNEPILRLMNSPEDLMGSVKGYMGIIYAGLIVTVAYNSLAAFLRALGDSKSPLYFLIISAVINVFLDILFIVKIGMGVEGCAYATVIAQAISAVCCLIYIIKKFPILHLKKENFEVSFTSFRYLLALGIPIDVYKRQLYVVSGMFVPFAILMMPLVKQTAEMGLDNKVGVIILYTVFYMPMNVLLYSGYLTNIPMALEEAACRCV